MTMRFGDLDITYFMPLNAFTSILSTSRSAKSRATSVGNTLSTLSSYTTYLSPYGVDTIVLLPSSCFTSVLICEPPVLEKST